MKKASLFIFLLFPCLAYAQDEPIDLKLGRFSFFIDTALMADGSMNNAGFGFDYNDVWGGEIRGQFTQTSETEYSSTPDTLTTFKETVVEMYLLPAQYKPAINQNLQWRFGAGLYYEYQKSDQKGSVEIPALSSYSLETHNSFTDDFSAHIAGPLLDIGLKYNSEWFDISFSGGFVPAYFLTTTEKQRMSSLYAAEHSQKKWGSPYFYLGLDSVVLKYINLAVKYNYARFKYDVIDFYTEGDASAIKFIPAFPESSVVSQSLLFEISAVLPLGSADFQIGYGHMLNVFTPDSGNIVRENKPYLILSGKKTSF